LKQEHYRFMASQLVSAPLSHGNQNTQCSQIWGPNGVLMGDAAHSMWPTLGQGVNSALEDATVLSQVLQDCAGDLDSVPLAFHKARHEDALAVVDLTWHSYGKGKHAISAISIIKSMLLFWGAKLLPGVVQRPALSLMNETAMPYSEIKRLQDQENQLLDRTAAAVGLTAAAATVAIPPLVFAPLAAAAGAVIGNLY
jgi:kynurenine 3-monooxygenase